MFVRLIVSSVIVVLFHFKLYSSQDTNLSAGDFCDLGNATGVCKYLNECSSAFSDLENLKVFPKICSFGGIIPLVCCKEFDRLGTTEETNRFTKGEDKPGDSCKLKNGTSGTCEHLTNCDFQTWKIFADEWNWCSEFNFREMLCCHKKKPKHAVACNDYRSLLGFYHIDNYIEVRKNKFDNTTVFHVVGGTVAKNGEFPHMALIGYGNRSAKSWNCGGTLISENYVLTAAHCLYDTELGSAKYVKLGAHDLTNPLPTRKEEEYDIIKTIKHDDYKPPQMYNDIALLKLDRNVNFTRFIHPACLYDKYSIPVDKLTASGWGATEYLGDVSNQLLKVDLSLYSYQECYSYYSSGRSNRILPRGIDNNTHLCSGGRDEEKDTCQGDSGGPLQTSRESDIFFVVGVTSFGKACAIGSTPGVYTRVSAYVPWIENIVWS